VKLKDKRKVRNFNILTEIQRSANRVEKIKVGNRLN